MWTHYYGQVRVRIITPPIASHLSHQANPSNRHQRSYVNYRCIPPNFVISQLPKSHDWTLSRQVPNLFRGSDLWFHHSGSMLIQFPRFCEIQYPRNERRGKPIFLKITATWRNRVDHWTLKFYKRTSTSQFELNVFRRQDLSNFTTYSQTSTYWTVYIMDLSITDLFQIPVFRSSMYFLWNFLKEFSL